MTKKLFVKTHGCQMNEYDSAKMIDLLKAEEDFELVDSEDQADLLILNTCSIPVSYTHLTLPTSG